MADIDELSSDSDDEEYIPEGTQLVNSKHNGYLNGKHAKKPLVSNCSAPTF